MLLIPCPHCGPRDQSEFSYGGLHISHPPLDASLETWHQAAHLRPHAKDAETELWYHGAGCERWFSVSRDLTTHAFASECAT